MKAIKYLFVTALAALAIGACTKHVIEFPAEDVNTSTTALFQLYYVPPVATSATNNIDQVYVNDKLVTTPGGVGQLKVNNLVPTTAARWYTVPAGTVNLKFYKLDEDDNQTLVYEKDVELQAKKQKIFVHNLEADPIIIDDSGTYKMHAENERPTVETFNTDSLCTIRFYNFIYENGAPYTGTIQYQWRERDALAQKDADGNFIWYNIGEPVAFGEATPLTPVIVHKASFNSSGSCRVEFRMIYSDGKANFDDWWTCYLGRRTDHIYRGILGGNPKAGVTVLYSM